MGNRVQLQTLFEDLLGSGNVYFQPPASVSLCYPCIIYSRELWKTDFANDKPYGCKVGYKVTVIDQNPDSLIPERIANLPMCSFDTHYTTDNLNHDVFNLYY
jgi:hypothetical protein